MCEQHELKVQHTMKKCCGGEDTCTPVCALEGWGRGAVNLYSGVSEHSSTQDWLTGKGSTGPEVSQWQEGLFSFILSPCLLPSILENASV
jgi:hypothetical protein